MKTLILAAGYATRLWPLTLERPKPLLPIKNNKPIVEYSIDKIKKIEAIDKIYIVTNTKFVKNFKIWASAYKIDKEIIIIDDGIKTVNERLGSIGDMLYSIKQQNINDDLLVVAGDNLFNFSLNDFVRFSVSHKPCVTIGLFDVGDEQLARQYGIASIDSEAKVIDFVEKPKEPQSTLAAMCMYFIPTERLSALAQYQQQGLPLDLAGNFIEWLSKREPVYGYAFKGLWLDIGDEKSLKYAQDNYWEGN